MMLKPITIVGLLMLLKEIRIGQFLITKRLVIWGMNLVAEICKRYRKTDNNWTMHDNPLCKN